MKSGFLLIDKKEGMTSQHVDFLVKKSLGEKKVGHLGTLDPFATGLLLIGVNDATKLFPFFEEGEKTYVATLSFGKETDTLDCYGQTIDEKEIVPVTEEQILSVFKTFIGIQEQTPPKYSAIHVAGKRAYELAKNNVDFEIEKRKIRIDSLQLVCFDQKQLTFRTTVSKGTYIRTLGKDIALKLNNLGYLSSLRREKIGNLDVKEAIQTERIHAESLIPMNKLLKYATKEIQDSQYKSVANGNPLFLPDENEEFLFLSYRENLLGLYEKNKDGYYHCRKGFKHE